MIAATYLPTYLERRVPYPRGKKEKIEAGGVCGAVNPTLSRHCPAAPYYDNGTYFLRKVARILLYEEKILKTCTTRIKTLESEPASGGGGSGSGEDE